MGEVRSNQLGAAMNAGAATSEQLAAICEVLDLDPNEVQRIKVTATEVVITRDGGPGITIVETRRVVL